MGLVPVLPSLAKEARVHGHLRARNNAMPMGSSVFRYMFIPCAICHIHFIPYTSCTIYIYMYYMWSFGLLRASFSLCELPGCGEIQAPHSYVEGLALFYIATTLDLGE